MEALAKQIRPWLGVGSINLFGEPFAGKDTQGRVLADLFHGSLVGGGEILRSHHDPAKIEAIMASGGLIPSTFYFDLVLPYISKPQFAGHPLILDAVGRSHGEEESVLEATKHSGHPLKAVVMLSLPEAEIWKRFDAAHTLHDRTERADDKRSVLTNRIAKFKEKTLPVIAFYRKKGLLVEVDGAQSRDDVTRDILQGLAEFASR